MDSFGPIGCMSDIMLTWLMTARAYLFLPLAESLVSGPLNIVLTMFMGTLKVRPWLSTILVGLRLFPSIGTVVDRPILVVQGVWASHHP